MITIRSLLDRIRWDDAFGKGRFRIGYYDRVRKHILYVDLERISFAEGEHFSFDAIDRNGAVHTVPLHRVRRVYRDGELIWERPSPERP